MPRFAELLPRVVARSARRSRAPRCAAAGLTLPPTRHARVECPYANSPRKASMDHRSQKLTALTPDRLELSSPVAERQPGIANPTAKSGKSGRDLGKVAPKKGSPHDPPMCAHKKGDAQPDGTAGSTLTSNPNGASRRIGRSPPLLFPSRFVPTSVRPQLPSAATRRTWHCRFWPRVPLASVTRGDMSAG